MLSRLTISNYALIEHLDFTPGAGLSIITGETGAGKSVMLGALSLLKGERADMKVIADKERKAVVEAVFEDIDGITSEKLISIDPEWKGEELIIRREIYPSGRSRSFINDTPALLSQLEEIAGGLLDIHSQNSNSLLSSQDVQLQLLDAVAENDDMLSVYIQEFNSYVQLRQKIRRIKEQFQKNKEQVDILAFKLGKLDILKPKSGELKKIEARYETLSHSQEIRESLMRARRALEGREAPGAIDQLEEAENALSALDFSIWEEEDPHIQDRLNQCIVELKDISETLQDIFGMTDFDPTTLTALSSRMNDYYSALKSFRVDSDHDLEELHAELRRQLDMIESGDSDTEDLERRAKSIAASLKKTASIISEKRKKAAASLQNEIEAEAKKLGLGNLRFEIKVSETKLNRSGGDKIDFLAAFNKNSVPAPVGEIASGGEMARLMLAVKKITSLRLKLPTIIFDEIDTGVSGSIADRMGEMMKEMSSSMQIVTITHLPQVAAKGERHFKVYKEDRSNKTISDVMLLSYSQREEEIGRMLSGEELNEAAIRNARSLLERK